MKNTFGLRSRLFPYTLAAILAGVLVTVALAAQLMQFERAIASARDMGRNVYIIQASSPDDSVAISRHSCESLTELDTVVRAGIIVSQGRQLVRPLGNDIPVLSVSQTLIPEVKGGNAVVGASLRASETSGHLMIGNVVTRAVTGNQEPVGIDVNSAVSVMAGSETVGDDRCFVEMHWAAELGDVQVATARLHVEGGGITAVAALRESLSATSVFTERVERWLPILIGGLGGLTTAMAIRARRGELAAYRFAGASSFELAVLVSIECVVIGGLAAVSGVLAALALSYFTFSVTSQIFAAIALGATWTTASIAVSVLAASRSPIELGKRR